MGWVTGLGNVIWQAGRASGRIAESAAMRAGQRRGSAAAARGVVGPFDPPPPPGASERFLDYRGLAVPRDLQGLAEDFPLGDYIEPRGRWRATQPIGLSRHAVEQHTLVVAPTRSGKTSSIIAPWIHAGVAGGYRVIAVDVKGNGDLLAEVKRYASTHGHLGAPVLSWDYRRPDTSASWNWIADLEGDAGAINAAVEAICGRPSPADPNRFFHLRAMKYLRGLLELAPTLPKPITVGDLVELLGDQAQLDAVVRARGGAPGAQRLNELLGLPSYDYLKVTSELLTYLEVLDTTGFVQVTRREELRMEQLERNSGYLAIVSAPIADRQLAAAASSIFLSQFLHRTLSRFGGTRLPTLLVLDEAPRLQDRLDLGSTLSMVAGSGTSVVLAAQDVAQFEGDQQKEILANCGNMVCLPGVSRASTAHLGERLGQRHQATVSDTRSAGVGGSTSGRTRAFEQVDVLGHREVTAPPFGEHIATVHARSVSDAPFLVDITREDLMAEP